MAFDVFTTAPQKTAAADGIQTKNIPVKRLHRRDLRWNA
jgi:hypothetical protein